MPLNRNKTFIAFITLFITTQCAHNTDYFDAVYDCDGGIGAVIINQHDDSDGITLDIQHQLYHLYSVRAASGAKYATEQGLKPETGLIWWGKGDEAMMLEMILDHTVLPEDYPLLSLCQKRG